MKIDLVTVSGEDFAESNDRLLKKGEITEYQAQYFSDIPCECSCKTGQHGCSKAATFRVGSLKEGQYLCPECLHYYVEEN